MAFSGKRRKNQRLTTVFKIVRGLVAVPSSHLISADSRTRANMSTNSRTFQHPQQSIRTHSFRVQYHNGTVLTKTCRSAISKLLQEPFAIVHLCTHHVGVISHLGSLPTIFQIQIYLLSCADIQDPPHRTSAYLSHLVTAPITLWAHSALLFRFAAFCTIT